jgi:DNA-binding Lrp family transcriptional regulator
MITSIVMIKCEVGKVKLVAEKLVDLNGVSEVYSVTGEWDILAVIRVKEFDSLATSSPNRSLPPRDRKNVTTLAFRCYSKHNMEKMWASFIGE